MSIYNDKFETKQIERIEDSLLSSAESNFSEKDSGFYNFIAGATSIFGAIQDYVKNVFRSTGLKYDELQDYKKGDIVSYNDEIYYSNIDVIAEVFDVSKWVKVVNSGASSSSTEEVINQAEFGRFRYYDRSDDGDFTEVFMSEMSVVRLDRYNFEFTFNTPKEDTNYSVLMKTEAYNRQYWNGKVFNKTVNGFKINISYYIKDYSNDYGKYVFCSLVIFN